MIHEYAHKTEINFSNLVDSYYAKVFYHCIKLMKNEHDAADITQNTFIKAFINISRLKNTDSAGPWLFTICNNEIKMFYRNKKREDKRISIEKRCGDDECLELYPAIDNLDEKYRNIILLKYFADFSMKEISLLLGIAEKTVKSRLYEARNKLRKIMLNESFLTTYHNKNRRMKIMSIAKLLDAGSQILPRMSNWGQKELMQCAMNNQKFTESVLLELSRIDRGEEFILECDGKISYDEFIQMLVCCDEATVYRLNGQDYKTWRNGKKTKLIEDISNYLNTGAYIDSVEMILYVPSIIDTVKWYKKYLGWDGDGSKEDEESGYSQIRSYNDDVAHIMSSTFKGFHLRRVGNSSKIINSSCFIFVTNIEKLRDKIIHNGWDKVTEIYDAGWGTKQFRLEDLNGFVIEFSEWICE